MAISKIIYKSSSEATPEVWMDATMATAAAADIASPKTAMLADGIMTTGTGGGSNWTLLVSTEYTVNTTATSNMSVGSIELPLSAYNDPQNVLWVHIRDKAGKRAGYFYGSETLFFHFKLADGDTSSLTSRPIMLFTCSSSNTYSGTASQYGVFGFMLNYASDDHTLKIYARYNSSYTGTINGTYQCDVYKLTMPSGMTLFT